MTSPFERLPTEVFDIIALYLDLSGYQVLRSTSRQLHLLSLSTFTKKYFTKLITTLGSPSLGRIVNVASHSHLSKLVTTLEIRLLNHRDYKDLTKIARIGIFPPPKRFPKVSCVKSQDIVQESTLYDDVLANRQSRCITEPLARALRGFANLKAIRFRAHQSEPLGWKTIAIPEGDEVFRSRCLRAVLDAIIRSQVELETFSMGKEKPSASLTKCANVPYPAFQLPIEHIQRLSTNFSPLASMSLSLVTHHTHPLPPGWENSLSHFLSSAPNLTHLTLSLDRNPHISPHSALILRSLSSSTSFPYLQTLHLHNTTAHAPDLTKLLQTHVQTLQRLSFTNISLLTGTWPLVLSALKLAPNLHVVRLANIHGSRSPVHFRRRDKERRKVVLDAGREGSSMGRLLDQLVCACEVEGLGDA